jgi:hypothetical protein
MPPSGCKRLIYNYLLNIDFFEQTIKLLHLLQSEVVMKRFKAKAGRKIRDGNKQEANNIFCCVLLKSVHWLVNYYTLISYILNRNQSFLLQLQVITA